MSIKFFNLPKVRPFRFIIVAIATVLMLFSTNLPASAIGTSKSSMKSGETQLNTIQKETDKLSDKLVNDNTAAPGMKETQAKTQKGLNAVQGAADANKMYRPSNSKEATTVENKVNNFLDNLTGN